MLNKCRRLRLKLLLAQIEGQKEDIWDAMIAASSRARVKHAKYEDYQKDFYPKKEKFHKEIERLEDLAQRTRLLIKNTYKHGNKM